MTSPALSKSRRGASTRTFGNPPGPDGAAPRPDATSPAYCFSDSTLSHVQASTRAFFVRMSMTNCGHPPPELEVRRVLDARPLGPLRVGHDAPDAVAVVDVALLLVVQGPGQRVLSRVEDVAEVVLHAEARDDLDAVARLHDLLVATLRDLVVGALAHLGHLVRVRLEGQELAPDDVRRRADVLDGAAAAAGGVARLHRDDLAVGELREVRGFQRRRDVVLRIEGRPRRAVEVGLRRVAAEDRRDAAEEGGGARSHGV